MENAGIEGIRVNSSVSSGSISSGDSAGVARDRVLTVPNLLSVLRLLGVPLFLWLALGPHADGWAIVVLAISSVTDWLDGKLARLLNQTSKLGQLLDPAADRLYIIATVLALSVRQILPWWLAGVLLGREVAMALCLAVLKRHGYGPLQVHFLGKAATLNLLYALPLLLLGAGHAPIDHAARTVGWAFAIWGTALYWYAGVLYGVQAWRLVRGGSSGKDDQGRAREPFALRDPAEEAPV